MLVCQQILDLNPGAFRFNSGSCEYHLCGLSHIFPEPETVFEPEGHLLVCAF